MQFFQPIILGIIQGLTEFLPISSSGHLIVLPKFFNWADQGLAFDVFLHLGTLLALGFFFYETWIKMIKGLIFFKDRRYEKERKLLGLIIVSMIPAIVFGFFVGNSIETKLRLPLVVGVSLIFWGLVLGLADWQRSKKKESTKNVRKLSKAKVFFIGLFQAIALIPGGSRSGLSITGGLFMGLSRKEAVRFSFLMSAPLILAALFWEGFNLIYLSSATINWLSLLIGLMSAFISGLLAIKLLTFLASRKNFIPFVLYRVILGILIIIFLV